MIKFGYKDYTTEYPDWAKHHKVIGLHVMTIYKDGTENRVKNKILNKYIDEERDQFIQKGVHVMREGNFEQATQYLLPLKNLDYIETDVPYYSTGASNTKQETSVRMEFRIDYGTFFLDYTFKGEKQHGLTFLDIVDDVASLLDEIASEDNLKDNGIAPWTGDKEEGKYHIVMLDERKDIIDIPISEYELKHALVGAEVYQFKLMID